MAKPHRNPTPSSEPAPTRPDHHGPAVAHPDDKPRPRWRRRLVRLALFLLLLLVVLVVAAPKLLSTGWGTRMLLAQVNSRIDGHVEARDVSLAWFSGLSAQGVKYTSGDGTTEVSAGRIDLPDTSVWALVTGDRAVGAVKVRDLHGVTIEPRREPPASAPPPPTDAPAGPAPPAPAPSPPAATTQPAADKPGWMHGLSCELEVDGLSWRYHAPDIVPVDLVSSALTLSLPGDGGARLRVDGALTQGEESGKFDLDLGAAALVDGRGRLQPGTADYTVDATVQQVPVDAVAHLVAGRTYRNKAVAHLLGTPERVAELLGGRWLVGEVNATGTLAELEGKLRLHSDRLDADLVLTSTGDALTMGDGTTLRLEVTPAWFAAVFPDRGLTLDGPVVLTCDEPTVVLPLAGGAVDKPRVTLRAVVNSGDWLLTDTDGRRVRLAAPKLGLAGAALGEELVAALDTVATRVVEEEADAAAAEGSTADAPRPATARLRVTGLFTPETVYRLRLTDMPTAVAEWAYGGMGGLAAAVGPTVQSVVGRVDRSSGAVRGGELSVNWDASSGAAVPGALAVLPPAAFTVDGAGVVTVSDGKDLEMQLVVTEALGDHWLGQLNPILFDAQSGDRPVRVVIDAETFAYPLGASGLAAATLDASVDLGTLRFGAESLFGYLFEWTGRPGEQAAFDPAALTLRDGVLGYDALGLTMGNVAVYFQGAVNLREKKLEAMSMHVPSESLLKVFQDLEGIVEPGDALIIPMRGGVRDPEVDMELFRSELVRLGTAAPRRAAERELNRVFERVREAVGGELGEEGGSFAEEAMRRLLGGVGGDAEPGGSADPPRDGDGADDGGGSFAEDVLRNLLGGRR